MDQRALIEALDQALDLLRQGVSMEEVLRQFPAYAPQLQPLLQVSTALWQLAHGLPPSSEPRSTVIEWAAGLVTIPQGCPYRSSAGRTRHGRRHRQPSSAVTVQQPTTNPTQPA